MLIVRYPFTLYIHMKYTKTRVVFKVVKIVRKSRFENRYHPDMGRIRIQVTRIRKHFIGIPIKTLHKYRETYSGEVKDTKRCIISKVEKVELSFNH